MAKTKLSTTSLNPIEGADYLTWLTTVPLEDRKRIAGLLREHRVEDYQTLIGFSQAIMVELVEGNITPVIARELRYWAELLFTIVATENSAIGTPEAAQQDIVTALIAVQQSVTTKPLAVPSREPVMILAEGE